MVCVHLDLHTCAGSLIPDKVLSAIPTPTNPPPPKCQFLAADLGPPPAEWHKLS
jgi:hypothetical protein